MLPRTAHHLTMTNKRSTDVQCAEEGLALAAPGLARHAASRSRTEAPLLQNLLLGNNQAESGAQLQAATHHRQY